MSLSLEHTNRDPKSLSIVVPCYNEEEVVQVLCERLTSALSPLNIPFELVLVDDGSTDRTWELLCQIQKSNSHLRIIRLSRNRGQQVAMTCGIDHARGQLVALMDADLQDPPELVPSMIEKWRLGYDVVYGRREKREGESISKKLFAFSFYRLFGQLTGFTIPRDTGDFRLMDRRVVDALSRLRERHRFIRGMVAWIGYPQTEVAYVRPGRFAGTTKYPFRKSLQLAIDAIVSFSYKPLRWAFLLGILVLLFSLVIIGWTLFLGLKGQHVSVFLSVVGPAFFLGGIQLICVGMLGEYVGRAFELGQDRPLYFVEDLRGNFLDESITKHKA